MVQVVRTVFYVKGSTVAICYFSPWPLGTSQAICLRLYAGDAACRHSFYSACGIVVVQMPSVAIMCVVSVLRYSIYGSTQNKGTFFMSISIILLTSIISYSHLSLSLKLNYYSCLAPSLQFFWMNGERFRRKHPCPIMQTCIEWQTGFQEVSTCCLCHNCENSKCSCIVTDRNLITPQVEIMFFWVGV